MNYTKMEKEPEKLAFEKVNYLLMLAGIAALVIGSLPHSGSRVVDFSCKGV